MSRKKKKTKKGLSSGHKKLSKGSISAKKTPFDIAGELTKALRYHQSGQLQSAEEIYRRILDTHPNHSDSLHLLGLVSHQSGQINVAEDLIKKAIQNKPESPAYYNNLGCVYKDQGMLGKAISCCQKAIELNPAYAEAHHNLGIVFKECGSFEEAISSCKKAIDLKPNYTHAFYNMGTVFQDMGKPKEAISCYQKAIHLNPDYTDAYYNMGTAFQDMGNLKKAISCYQDVVKVKPDYAEAYNNMGNVLQDQGKRKDAISAYQKALEIKPDFAEAYNNLGYVLIDEDRSSDAISFFQKALEIKPHSPEVYNNMGNAFKEQGELSQAVFCYKKALEMRPDYAEAYNNMGIAYQDFGNAKEAVSSYRKALEIKPDFAEAQNNMGNAFQGLGNAKEAITSYQGVLEIKPEFTAAYCELFHQLQRTCEWQELEAMPARLDASTEEALQNGSKTAESPFINLARQTDPSRNFAIAKSWSLDITKAMSNLGLHFPFDETRSSRSKISVGYLSNDFRDHAMTHLMLGLFGLHDRDKFEILCYSYGENDGSCYRERIVRDCDMFVDLQNLDHADAARRINADEVDILIDLKGYTGGGRLEICALRPAPIQVRYLGLASTTGADFFDYIITDRIVTPRDHALHFSENFLYMPHCYQINDHQQAISEKDWKKADFGLPEDSFVFCSFNQGYKIEPVMFDCWMGILRQVPGSVMWLHRENETAEKNLRNEAEKRGVSSSRLIFAGKLPREEHLGRLRLADLALDTRIVSGAATTSDALWAGVPVITLEGGNFASRMSSSILSAIGLPELIAQSLEAYEALALRLALNQGELRAVGQTLAKNRLTEPLFDTPRFTRNLEKAYEEMWEIFVSGERPRQIEMVED